MTAIARASATVNRANDAPRGSLLLREDSQVNERDDQPDSAQCTLVLYLRVDYSSS